MRVQPLGLDENLVRSLVREPNNLVLNRRTVAGPYPLNDAGEHRRSISRRTNDLVRPLVCLRNETINLLGVLTGPPQKREHGYGLITRLCSHRGEIERAPVDPGRRSGLQPTDPQGQLTQPLGEPVRRGITRPAALVVIEADVNAPSQERPHGQHHRRRLEGNPGYGDHAPDALTLNQEVRRLLLEQRQVRLIFEDRSDRLPVQLPVCLGPCGSHRRALAGVQGAELDAGLVRRARHGPAERVDLPDQVALTDAADRRIAAHLPERLDALSQKKRTRAHPRGGQRGLRAGMASANDDHVIGQGETHVGN